MLPSHFSVLNLGIFACVVVFFLLVVLFFLIDFNAKTRCSSLPGIDSSDPDKGNFEDIQDAGSLHEFLVNLHAEYGPLVSFWWGPKLVVSLASPHMFNEVKNIFDKPRLLYEAFSDLIGERSVQLTNGALGRRKRKIIDDCLVHGSTKAHYENFLKVSEEVANKWQDLPAEQHIGLSQYMLAMTVKAFAHSVFGRQLSDEKVMKLRKAYQTCYDELLLQVKGNMPEEGDGRKDKYQNNKKIIRGLIKDVIEERRSVKNKEGNVILDSLLLHGDVMDGEELIDQAITLLVGSFHTTGYMMTWCLYFLATHEDIQDRVYEELSTVLNEENITSKDISKLNYTKQVIEETLRCSVLDLWTARITEYDLQIGEHLIPKETPMILELGIVMKDEDQWVDPNRFDPERFTVENSEERHPLAFEPFGFAGKRKCPGHNFAYAEAFVILSVLLRRFKISLVDGQVIEPVYDFVTTPSDEIWITINKR